MTQNFSSQKWIRVYGQSVTQTQRSTSSNVTITFFSSSSLSRASRFHKLKTNFKTTWHQGKKAFRGMSVCAGFGKKYSSACKALTVRVGRVPEHKSAYAHEKEWLEPRERKGDDLFFRGWDNKEREKETRKRGRERERYKEGRIFVSLKTCEMCVSVSSESFSTIRARSSLILWIKHPCCWIASSHFELNIVVIFGL